MHNLNGSTTKCVVNASKHGMLMLLGRSDTCWLHGGWRPLPTSGVSRNPRRRLRNILIIRRHLAPLRNAAPPCGGPELHGGARGCVTVLAAECVVEVWWNMRSKVKVTYSGEG